VVAPGERVVSCAAGGAKERIRLILGQQVTAAPNPVSAVPIAAVVPATSAGAVAATPAVATATAGDFEYLEDSGTSMAAPHASGVIAAFLSVRREFIGEPEKVAALVSASAVDLKRDASLQGSGLIDLFRMLQSV
jgi:hypothetical protein